MLRYIHYRHTRYFPYPILQVLIIRRHNVTFVLSDFIHNAVVSVCALMQARQPFESRIRDYPQRQLVLRPQFLQFSANAIRDVGNALGVEAIHHILDDIEFTFYAEVDEIGIDDNVVWRTQLRVVLEEER